jgi:hypothetical protein
LVSFSVSPPGKRSDTVTFANTSTCRYPAEWGSPDLSGGQGLRQGRGRPMARIPGTKYSCIHASETRSGDARVPEYAWDVPSAFVETEFPGGVGGDNYAGPCAVVCRGEWPEWGRERALHPNAARSYRSRLGTRKHRRYQGPVPFTDSFRIIMIWEDFVLRTPKGLLRVYRRWLGPLPVTVYTAIAKWRTENKLVHFHRN